MAKTNLKQSSGLPLFFNGDDIQSDEYSFTDVSVVDLDSIRPQLLNQDLDCPDVFYTKYKDIDNGEQEFKNTNLRVNIYLMKPNLAGIEFTKTKATKCNRYPRVFEIIYGGGSVIIQNYQNPLNNKVYKIYVKKGSKLIVPPGYSISLVNTRQTSTLIALEISSRDARTRVVLEDKRGMSYYIIRKNAKVEIVRNPAYKIVNDIEKLDQDNLLKEYGITEKTPLIKQILRKNEKFNWLFKENSITI